MKPYKKKLIELKHDLNFDTYFTFALDTNYNHPIPLAKEIVDLLNLSVNKSGMTLDQRKIFWDEMKNHSIALRNILDAKEVRNK